MKIPKIIHYCWFGGKPLPKLAKKCIDSWKKYLPDYEIKCWDESNFDVNIIPYTREAYELKKYAFVSDYARFWILNNYGGLYFDTDVELIKGIDDIIANGAFMGCEHPANCNLPPNCLGVAPGLGFGMEAGHIVARTLVDYYSSKTFINPDGKASPETVVTITTEIFCKFGLKNTQSIQQILNTNIYPSDYFCPISTDNGKLRITSNTRSIHWYDQSWQSPSRKYGRKLIVLLGGDKLKNIIKKILYRNS